MNSSFIEIGNLYFVLEILGTIAFAISGAMVGVNAKMDVLGVTVLGLTTAVGGGIIRDLLIGKTPPAAFQDPTYAIIALVVSLIIFLPKVRSKVNTDLNILTLVDAIGLGVFTVIGTRAGIIHGGIFLQVFLGTVTGVGGGVLRDIFAMEKPMIFVKHFYASASIIGAIFCALALPYNSDAAMLGGMLLTIILRILAAKFKWHLPKADC